MKIGLIKLMVATALLSLVGCQKQDHAYKEFVEDGERVYIGKVDSVQIMPGKNRVGLSWIVKDPRIKSIKIKYNDDLDSILLNVEKSDSADLMETIIENLDERNYSFKIFALDNKGNQSIAQSVDGQSYGDNYRLTLNNRVRNRVTNVGNNTTITWFTGNSSMINTEIEYTNLTGETVNLVLPANSNTITLTEINRTKEVRWRTSYLPVENALDIFYTDYSTFTIN